MKKGKVFSKGQLAVAVMLLALGAAVWLNTKYLPSSTKYLGEASYVNSNQENNAVETGTKVEKGDYFATAKKDRQKARELAKETVEELLDTDKLSEEDKNKVLDKINATAKNIENESNVETILSAKGFEKVLAVISDSAITIVVKSEGLTSAQTLQIQDVVTNETGVALSNIKIIPVA